MLRDYAKTILGNHPRQRTVKMLARFLRFLLFTAALFCLVMFIGVHYERSWTDWIVTKPPGTFIGFLGAFAMVLAVLEEPKDALGRAAAIVIVFSMLYFETVDIQRGETKHESQFKETMDHFSRVEALLLANVNAINRVTNIREQTQGPETSTQSLKRRAAELCRAILAFLVKQKIHPGFGQGGFGTGPYGGGAIDEKITMEMYKRDYESQVIALRSEFAKRGMLDSELDAEYLHPLNSYSIRSIAERFGALSDRL